ncbi:hypothetical protein GCM10023328_34170 [Modestobacter marinus]|uniref:Uncharacterized protein n=1 Tax=Modestobacter marinus TaxID=477641 RepID=A0ABQ2FXA5_9ACTN|nr:hypothetical protein GCM10011589_19850 [Modestobacter marinus]
MLFRGGSGWSAGGLVVAGGVEGEFAEEFAGGGVDDADVQVLDQEQDVGSGVGSADADVVEAAGQAEAEAAGGVDAVGADPVVGCRGCGRRRGRLWAVRRRRWPGWLGAAVTDAGGRGCRR